MPATVPMPLCSSSLMISSAPVNFTRALLTGSLPARLETRRAEKKNPRQPSRRQGLRVTLSSPLWREGLRKYYDDGNEPKHSRTGKNSVVSGEHRAERLASRDHSRKWTIQADSPLFRVAARVPPAGAPRERIS